jgi:hypothetical protein
VFVFGSDVFGGALARVAETEVKLDTVVHSGRRSCVEVDSYDWPRRSFDEETTRPSFISGWFQAGGVEDACGGRAEHHGVFGEGF